MCSVEMLLFCEQFYKPQLFAPLCESCPRYGAQWSCPPFETDPIDKFKQFAYIHLLVSRVETENVAFASFEEVTEYCHQLMFRVRLALDRELIALERCQQSGGAMAFLPGYCHWCVPENCTRGRGENCCKPHLVRPSLEAVGFDLSSAVERLTFCPMIWSKAGEMPQYLTFVSAVASQGAHLCGTNRLNVSV